MANVYGDKRAGQYAKSNAHIRTRQIWRIVCIVCTVVGFLMGCLGCDHAVEQDAVGVKNLLGASGRYCSC